MTPQAKTKTDQQTPSPRLYLGCTLMQITKLTAVAILLGLSCGYGCRWIQSTFSGSPMAVAANPLMAVFAEDTADLYPELEDEALVLIGYIEAASGTMDVAKVQAAALPLLDGHRKACLDAMDRGAIAPESAAWDLDDENQQRRTIHLEDVALPADLAAFVDGGVPIPEAHPTLVLPEEAVMMEGDAEADPLDFDDIFEAEGVPVPEPAGAPTDSL